MKKKKKYSYIRKAIGTQIAAGATVGLPYHLMGSIPSNAGSAVTGMARTMQPVPTLMGVVPTIQVSKGIFKELKKKR